MADDDAESGLEHRYAPLVASLRAGGHADPAQGWGAALIGAHVARNNDLLAEVAERVAAGEAPGYDNAAAVDPEGLADLAALPLDQLADAVERSAARLARARDALGPRADVRVHARIVDDDRVVVDEDVAIGDLVDGNAGFHLERHREELRALEPARPGAPPAAFDRHQLVLLVERPDAPDLSPEEDSALLVAHLGFFAVMTGLGLMRVAGPLRGGDDPALAGVSVYAAPSREAARRLAEDDPAVRAGVYRIEAYDWWTPAGVLFGGAVTAADEAGAR